MMLKDSLGRQMLEIMERTISRSGKAWEILGAPRGQTKPDLNGPDSVCLSCLSHNPGKSNTKMSKCYFYRHVCNVNTCQVLNTCSLYSDYLSCDLLILYELLHFRLCSGFITLKMSFIVGDDDVERRWTYQQIYSPFLCREFGGCYFFSVQYFFFTIIFSVFKFDIVSCSFSNFLWNALVL